MSSREALAWGRRKVWRKGNYIAETTDRPRLVVLTGSFNPPTLAHLDLLKKAMAAVGAERGLFLPANDAYVRRKMANESIVIRAGARIAMLEAMCRVEPSLGISHVDMGAARRFIACDRIKYRHHPLKMNVVDHGYKVLADKVWRTTL